MHAKYKGCPQVTDAKYALRVRAKCAVDEKGCWLWQGSIGGWGYGHISYRGKSISVHVLMYRITKGAIHKGMRVCHTCDVRHCCNPEHLWLGTQQENIRDCSEKKRHTNGAKTHCYRGHEFTPENTLITDAGKGRKRRQCKACNRIRLRIAAGWPEQQAISVGVVSHGHRPVGASWQSQRKNI
jgi:hypothetical protein